MPITVTSLVNITTYSIDMIMGLYINILWSNHFIWAWYWHKFHKSVRFWFTSSWFVLI